MSSITSFPEFDYVLSLEFESKENNCFLFGDDILKTVVENIAGNIDEFREAMEGEKNLSLEIMKQLKELLIERAEVRSIRTYIAIGLRDSFPIDVDVDDVIRITKCPKTEKEYPTFGCALWTWGQLAFYIASVGIDEGELARDEEEDSGIEDLMTLHAMNLARKKALKDA